MARALHVERVAGIEPASSAWKAEVLAVELHPRAGRRIAGLGAAGTSLTLRDW